MGELIENQLTGVTKTEHDAEWNRAVTVAYWSRWKLKGVWGGVG